MAGRPITVGPIIFTRSTCHARQNKDGKLVICAVASFQLQVVHGYLNLCVPPLLLALINYAAVLIARNVVHDRQFTLPKKRRIVLNKNIDFCHVSQENLGRIKFPRLIRGSFADCIQHCIVSGMQQEGSC